MTLTKLISWNVGSRVKDRRSAQLEWISYEQVDVLAFQKGASDLQLGLSTKHFASNGWSEEACSHREPLRAICIGLNLRTKD